MPVQTAKEKKVKIITEDDLLSLVRDLPGKGPPALASPPKPSAKSIKSPTMGAKGKMYEPAKPAASSSSGTMSTR